MARYGADEIERLIERIRRRKPDGWTALYDAVGVYLNGVGPLDGQKIMLLYTDGGDTRSELTFSDLLDLLKSSDVTVYAIGYLENQPSSARTQQQTQLQRIAAITGGQAFFPSSVKELDKIYEKIQREIAARYSLGYIVERHAQGRRVAQGRDQAEARRTSRAPSCAPAPAISRPTGRSAD